MLGKVIIVESDKQVVGILKGPFEEAGFQVEVAPSGEEGLALCLQFLPQVALVDVDLPDLDGLEVCRKLRSATRTGHIHIIVLARSVDRQARIRALETGVDDFIIIPFDPDEVTLRVRNALRRASADNLTDPVTGLPSGRLIQNRLRDLVVSGQDDWALLGLTIRYLEPFKETHGFLAAQEVLRSVARVLAAAVDQWGGTEDFIGHSGGGRFLVVTNVQRADDMTASLVENFQREILTHYTFREREQGFIVLKEDDVERQIPLMRLDVRKVTQADGPFYDIRSLTEALG
ncbi:MAG: response regulator [Anaerolineae bacterium]|nr:response regulator [Anaerolineae bacterium]